MKKKRIALVYDVIYPYVKGGGEKRFYELGKRLKNKNTEVHLYGMKFWDGPKVIKKDGMYLHGIMKARPIYKKDGTRVISQAILFGIACFKLFGEDFDVIDCCGFPYFSLFPCKLVALTKRKPLYATWHEVWGKKYWNKYLGKMGILGYWVEWIAARLPNHIIVVSAHTENLLRSRLHTKRKVSVVANGIDTSLMKSIKPHSEKTDIIFSGRLMDYKNVHILLHALHSLKERGTEVILTVIGEGPERERLEKLAKDLGLNNQIHWLGFLEDSNEVYARIKSAKAFVLPSMREGFGIVAVEANACNTPVITGNYEDNAAKDLIEDGKNGSIFEPTLNNLAEIITKTLDQCQRMQKHALHISKKYDWNEITNTLRGVYAL